MQLLQEDWVVLRIAWYRRTQASATKDRRSEVAIASVMLPDAVHHEAFVT